MIDEFFRMQQKESVIKSKKEATDYLEDFLAITDLPKEGDYVERNKFGEKKYSKPTGNQVAKVIKVLNEPTLDDRKYIMNAYIAVVCEDGDIVCFGVDLRFYQTVKAIKGKNVFSLIGGRK